MRKTNDPLVVKQQYAAANNLETRLSLHDNYSTNKQGFGNWIFSTVEKREYIDSLAITNIDDMVEYIYSLSSMMPLRTVPRQTVKEILMKNAANGVLRVPKEYGMFLAS